MADDAILDTEPEPIATPPTVPAAQPSPAPTVDLEAAISKALGPLSQRLDAIDQRLNPPPAPPPPLDPNAQKPLNERLWLQPEETLREFTTQELRRVLGPTVAVTLSSLEKQALATVGADFDKVHGEGSFKEHILPGFQKLRERMTAEQRADVESVRAVVNYMKGEPELDEKLYEKRKELESKPPPPAGPRGSRREPTKPEVPDEVVKYLRSNREATGTNFSEEDWTFARNAGNDFDSWQKAAASRKKAS